MSTKQLILTVRGAPTAEVIAAGIRCGWLPERAPDIQRINEGTGSWSQRFVETALDPWVGWGDEEDTDAAASHGSGVTIMGVKTEADPARIFAQLQEIPFEIGEISNIHPEWRRPPLSYAAPSFGLSMPRHGWICAFRGAGHDRLVSRRWLSHGPWRLHRFEGADLSIVEFHDAAADAETALAQARPGHRRMGNTDEGGYIQPSFVYTAPPRGFYDPATRLLKAIINQRPVTQRELLEACAVRVEPNLTDPGPIRNVAYVFMVEEEAQQNLHELWLRGLECRAIRLGQEIRLDDQYDPKPPPPPF